MIYPVITLYQPWATWVVRGIKPTETRLHNRFQSLIGKTILIHAGQHMDAGAFVGEFVTDEARQITLNEYPQGAIIGSVFVDAGGWLCSDDSAGALIDCHHAYGRYGLFLMEPKEFAPIPEKGSMGIWYYDLDKKEKVKKNQIITPNLFTP